LAQKLTVYQAIRYAVEVWQVDIISMSFGFPERVNGYTELENAILDAYRSSVLLFAAASNSGANLDRAYPARHQEVICIHSTDANGNRSTFSPTATNSDDNFATIGEAVESAWPIHLCNQEKRKTSVAHKSGTSFATPIAAGIGAFLLQYSRLHLSEEEAKMLKRSSGMKAVLRRISKKREGSKERDGYEYIAPSRYSDNFFGKSESHVKVAIVDALKNS
jgi:subtilisin family serine protease